MPDDSRWLSHAAGRKQVTAVLLIVESICEARTCWPRDLRFAVYEATPATTSQEQRCTIIDGSDQNSNERRHGLTELTDDVLAGTAFSIEHPNGQVLQKDRLIISKNE